MESTLTTKNRNSGTAREASTVMAPSACMAVLREADRDTLFAVCFRGEEWNI